MDTVSVVHTFALQEVYSYLQAASGLHLYSKVVKLSASQESQIQPPGQCII